MDHISQSHVGVDAPQPRGKLATLKYQVELSVRYCGNSELIKLSRLGEYPKGYPSFGGIMEFGQGSHLTLVGPLRVRVCILHSYLSCSIIRRIENTPHVPILIPRKSVIFAV